MALQTQGRPYKPVEHIGAVSRKGRKISPMMEVNDCGRVVKQIIRYENEIKWNEEVTEDDVVILKTN